MPNYVFYLIDRKVIPRPSNPKHYVTAKDRAAIPGVALWACKTVAAVQNDFTTYLIGQFQPEHPLYEMRESLWRRWDVEAAMARSPVARHAKRTT